MNLKSPKFKKLQDKWYNKLKNSGFEDIEQADGNLKKQAKSIHILYYKPVAYEAKQRYFELAGQFLYWYKFKNEVEKKIWTLHSEGMSNIKISKVTGVYVQTVNHIVKALGEELKKRNE